MMTTLNIAEVNERNGQVCGLIEALRTQARGLPLVWGRHLQAIMDGGRPGDHIEPLRSELTAVKNGAAALETAAVGLLQELEDAASAAAAAESASAEPAAPAA